MSFPVPVILSLPSFGCECNDGNDDVNLVSFFFAHSFLRVIHFNEFGSDSHSDLSVNERDDSSSRNKREETLVFPLSLSITVSKNKTLDDLMITFLRCCR